MKTTMDSTIFYELKREKEQEIAQRRWDYAMEEVERELKNIGSFSFLIEEMSHEDQEDFKKEVIGMLFK
ncbi:hypothetical protein [Campylobacter ureolyticus]|uniref:Uncharacterized protein n=1 Tax=Campylobacter ureolyticus TaxID=827 RepID=A0A9Q4KKU9_9BACT|nr:hypothetical protein [Campylobacter ureolyticus]MCZ6102899.1 hypothetical protein [Campylobacter ureolyticus]MCZ6161956.1 hypothetical protein [Campylobacter ureolyticus]MCZ6170968.1 hypothetical protein [Campylobacter ureolyticus]